MERVLLMHAFAYNSLKEICVPPLICPSIWSMKRVRCWVLSQKPTPIIFALSELVRRGRIEQLKSMMGSVRLDIDLAKSRRRLSNR